MNWIGTRRVDPFWMHLPPDVGELAYACDLRDGLMREVYLTGRYEPQETALLRHLLRPGMTLVDVGANWGYFTLVGAHLVGASGCVRRATRRAVSGFRSTSATRATPGTSAWRSRLSSSRRASDSKSRRVRS